MWFDSIKFGIVRWEWAQFIQFSLDETGLKVVSLWSSYPSSLWIWSAKCSLNYRDRDYLNRRDGTFHNFEKGRKIPIYRFVIISFPCLPNFKVSIINMRGRGSGHEGKRSKTNIGPIEFPRGDTPFTPIRRGRCFSRDNLKATLHASFPSVLFHPASFLFRLHLHPLLSSVHSRCRSKFLLLPPPASFNVPVVFSLLFTHFSFFFPFLPFFLSLSATDIKLRKERHALRGLFAL